MAERVCTCGRPVPVGRHDGWCSSWCQVRTKRGLPPQPPPLARPVSPGPASPGPVSGPPRQAPMSVAAPVVESAPPPVAPLRRAGLLEQRVLEKLRAAGVDDDWQAAQALDLAARIEDGSAKGSALAALHRELRAVMGELLAGAADSSTSVGRYRDELASRRAARAGGDG